MTCSYSLRSPSRATLAKAAFDYIEADYLRILEPLSRFEPLVPEGEYFLRDDPQLLAV